MDLALFTAETATQRVLRRGIFHGQGLNPVVGFELGFWADKVLPHCYPLLLPLFLMVLEKSI